VIAASSVAGLKSYPGAAVYGGAKWFVRAVRANIRAATIYPAAINTELLTTISDEGIAKDMTNFSAN
jgi:NADP-dependent 3-hydroxy acid dehydrogenase YdfG